MLRNNQMRYFDPMGVHLTCLQEDATELFKAIRRNESAIGFWFDPFVPSCDNDDTLQQDYVEWCYDLLDACSHLRNLRRAYMNVSHFPLSMSQVCHFLNQARHLEHFSFGSLVSVNEHSFDDTCWLDGSFASLLQVLREHSYLSCFDLHLPDQQSGTHRAFLSQLHSLSNLKELRVSFGRACPDRTDHTTCWISLLLQHMPHLRRLSLRNAVHSHGMEFATALQNNTTLHELHLVCNHFDELGWKALAQVLQTNISLQKLSIHGGNVNPDTFLSCLACALHWNHFTALSAIHIAGVASETTNSDALLALLQTNTTLQSIEMEGLEENEQIELYLKLNRAGRAEWQSNLESCWNCMLHQDLDCIYTMLQENPALCTNGCWR